MKSIKLLSLLVLFASLATACSRKSGDASPSRSPSPMTLQGAGATFPYPLYAKWTSEYQTVAPALRINYQSIGSGGGIRQLTERTVDFGASDAPMTAEALQKAGAPVLHIPTTIGAVVLAYNLPGNPSLRLTSEAVAALFLGQITRWNDPMLAALNPTAKLPDLPVTLLHRSDGSGTTSVFTSYLAETSAAWKSKVGAGLSVSFPAGLGAKGNEGIAGQLKVTPGAVGYLELAYAKQLGITSASLQNRAGHYIEPTLESLTAAAGSASNEGRELTTSIANSDAPDAYPLASFTYLLVYQKQSDPAKAAALGQYIAWALHDGQKFGPPLHYAPLPAGVVAKAESLLKTIQ